jgi:hypothetical protein
MNVLTPPFTARYPHTLIARIRQSLAALLVLSIVLQLSLTANVTACTLAESSTTLAAVGAELSMSAHLRDMTQHEPALLTVPASPDHCCDTPGIPTNCGSASSCTPLVAIAEQSARNIYAPSAPTAIRGRDMASPDHSITPEPPPPRT